jgi:hypothetical protein
MSARDALHRLAAEQQRGRILLIGAGASALWLALAALFAALAPGDGAEGGSWLIWVTGLLLPLALIWLAVWSARSLSLLREEARELRALLALMQDDAEGQPAAMAPDMARASAATAPTEPRATRPAPAPPRPAPAAAPARPASDGRQASLQLDSPPATQLTAPELFFALNFPDGPEDREAIRCLRLALADPGLARLIRAAQDVVTLLAGQGVYMDELRVPESDPDLWRRFAEGARGDAVAGLAVIRDENALETAGQMLRGDEVFRDVAHHFLRHFDRLLNRRTQEDEPHVLAVLAETRSGRAFTLLAQVTGMLGSGNAMAAAN